MQSGNQGNKIILSAGFVQSNKNVFCSQNRIKWKYIQIYRLVFRMFWAPEYLIDQGDHSQIQNFSNFPEKKYMFIFFLESAFKTVPVDLSMQENVLISNFME